MADHIYSKSECQEKASYSSSPRKRKLKRARDKRTKRINIGAAFTRWRCFMKEKGIERDAGFACFLLDSHVNADEVIVRLESLVQLFYKCNECRSECRVSTKRDGRFLYVSQRCPQCHSVNVWRSHPPDYIISNPAAHQEAVEDGESSFEDEDTEPEDKEAVRNLNTLIQSANDNTEGGGLHQQNQSSLVVGSVVDSGHSSTNKAVEEGQSSFEDEDTESEEEGVRNHNTLIQSSKGNTEGGGLHQQNQLLRTAFRLQNTNIIVLLKGSLTKNTEGSGLHQQNQSSLVVGSVEDSGHSSTNKDETVAISDGQSEIPSSIKEEEEEPMESESSMNSLIQNPEAKLLNVNTSVEVNQVNNVVTHTPSALDSRSDDQEADGREDGCDLTRSEEEIVVKIEAEDEGGVELDEEDEEEEPEEDGNDSSGEEYEMEMEDSEDDEDDGDADTDWVPEDAGFEQPSATVNVCDVDPNEVLLPLVWCCVCGSGIENDCFKLRHSRLYGCTKCGTKKHNSAEKDGEVTEVTTSNQRTNTDQETSNQEVLSNNEEGESAFGTIFIDSSGGSSGGNNEACRNGHQEEGSCRNDEGESDEEEGWSSPLIKNLVATFENLTDFKHHAIQCHHITRFRRRCPDCRKFLTMVNTIDGGLPHVCEHKVKPAVCSSCGKRFTSDCRLQKHIKYIHSEKYRLTCRYCLKTFKSPADKEEHEEEHEEEELKYHCPDCPRQFSDRPSWCSHRNSHWPNGKHVCDVCNKSFCNENGLMRHIRVHTGVKSYRCEVGDHKCEPPMVWCNNCHSDFTRSCFKFRHKRIYGCLQCGTKEEALRDAGTVNPELNASSSNQEVSEAPTTTSAGSQESNGSNSQEIWTTDTDSAEHKSVNFHDLAVCFEDLQSFQKHAQQCHGVKQFREPCPDCGKFITLRNKVSGGPPHICEYKARPNSCLVCGKGCASKKGLLSHMTRVHLRGKPYIVRCLFCLKRFTFRKQKIEHEKIHQNEELKFSCPHCPLRFADVYSRSAHFKTHRVFSTFTCKVCSRTFKQACKLERHMAVHTGLKPYTCKVCERSFNQPGHLKSHMRVHTGEKPFMCHECGLCYTHNVSLKNHVQHHHGSGAEGKKEKKGKGRGRTRKKRP